jgi:hypothetical protein
MLNKHLVHELQNRASNLGVALALPKYITRLDPISQNHIVYAASQEILMLEREAVGMTAPPAHFDIYEGNCINSDTELYIDGKSRCSKCKKVFPYKEVYWWHGIQLCGACYPIVTGKPKPEYWR